jgi:opacity protein-like surface antigen
MHETSRSSRPRVRRAPFARALALSFFALAVLAIPRRAHALINIGPEAGIVKRSADSPNNLKLGLGYGAHAELDMLPLLKVGPYYFHYELASADTPAPGSADATFNTLGLRGRLILPVPGSFKPYAYIGAGYSWVTYVQNSGDHTGRFVEIPIGVGIIDEVADIFHLSLDVAYRPGVAFGGTVYDAPYNVPHPSSGWSVLLGVALNL